MAGGQSPGRIRWRSPCHGPPNGWRAGRPGCAMALGGVRPRLDIASLELMRGAVQANAGAGLMCGKPPETEASSAGHPSSRGESWGETPLSLRRARSGRGGPRIVEIRGTGCASGRDCRCVAGVPPLHLTLCAVRQDRLLKFRGHPARPSDRSAATAGPRRVFRSRIVATRSTLGQHTFATKRSSSVTHL